MFPILILIHCSVNLALARDCPWSCTCQPFISELGPRNFSDNQLAPSAKFHYAPASSIVYQEYTERTGSGYLDTDGESDGETSYECVLKFNDSLSNLLKSINADVRKLSLRKSRLTSITTICRFSKLEQLDLSWNDFDHVLTYESYVICANLRLLNLSYNHIKELRRDEFASFPYLETLDLSNNAISTISEDTFRLPRLLSLDLSHNQLTQIPARIFRFLSQLREIDMSSNLFDSMDFATMVYLVNVEELKLTNNRIRFIHSKAFENIGRLKRLNLAGNQLSSVPPSSFLQHLESLVMDANPITVVDQLNTFPVLRNLSLSHMPALELVLNGSFSQLPQLQALSMRNNSRLSYFSPGALNPDSSVYSLDLRNNALKFVSHSVFAMPKLQRILLSSNPLQIPCFVRNIPGDLLKKSDIYSKSTGKRDKQRCTVELYPPVGRTEITGRIGAPLRVYCCIICPMADIHTTWTAPSYSHRYSVTDEFLEIDYTLENDTGVFVCTAMRSGRVVARRKISVTLAIPNFQIFVKKLAHYYVTLAWNRSTSEERFGFYLRYKPEKQNLDTDSGWMLSPQLSLFPKSYSLVSLAPATNYSICLVYRPRDEILHEDCMTVQTANLIYSQIGLSLSYTLIALIAGVSLTCCMFCCVRCTYHRFHVWQREKIQSRMQESISAQGFFSSFDSISTANIAVTYENPHRVEVAIDGSPEEAVRLVKHDAQLHTIKRGKADDCADIEMTNGRAPSAMTM